MKGLLRYIIWQLLIGLIFGIILQFYGHIWQFGFQKLIVINLIIIGLLLFFHRRKSAVFFTVTSCILTFFIGISSIYFQNDKNHKRYYKNFLKDDFVAVFKIEKVLKSNKYNAKYIAEVTQINEHKTIGRVLVNIQKDSLRPSLYIDDEIILKPFFKSISPSLNPHQFSYKKYLAKQYVFKQVFVKKHRYKKIKSRSSSLRGMVAKWRISIIDSLKKYPFSKSEFAVINALILGQRAFLSKKLVQSYSGAGVIHILAVSGLHVGVLFLILTFLFSPLGKSRFGEILKPFLIVLFLWGFAFFVGLSASVVRAVTMFTFVAVGQSFQRKKIVEHSLITSMFFLLLFKPLFLFDIGFQLSYIAVFGIIWIQPKIYKMLKIKQKIIRCIWKITTGSLAAQLIVLPISLFYFHQFPGLFLLSNLIIIPVIGGILGGGIVVILLAFFGILPLFIVRFYGDCIWLMNQFVDWVSHQKAFLFKEISMSFLMMIAFYLLIISIFIFLSKRNSKRFLYFLGSIILLQSVFIFRKYRQNTHLEFIVFSGYKKSIIGKRIGNNLTIYSNLKNAEIQKSKAITSYRIGEHITTYNVEKKPSIFSLKKHVILRVDSLGIYRLEKLVHPIVLLENSSKINLNRLIKTLEPSEIIADVSNYKNITNLWKITCEKWQIPFYNIAENGAFILSLK